MLRENIKTKKVTNDNLNIVSISNVRTKIYESDIKSANSKKNLPRDVLYKKTEETKELQKNEEHEFNYYTENHNPRNESLDYMYNLHEDDSLGYCNREISVEEEKLIKTALKKHFMFDDIDEELMLLVMRDIIEYKILKGRMLYEEGDDGNFFYIVKSGTLSIFSKGVHKGYYNPWDCFGELALIQKCKRKETVISATDAEVFIVDGGSFRELLVKMNEIKMKDRLEFLNCVPIFNSLNNIEKNNIAAVLKLVTFLPGEKIIAEDDIGEKMYIIKEGCVSCRFKSKEIRKLFEKQFFGQKTILIDQIRSIDVISLYKTDCYEVSRTSLEEALGSNYKEAILYSMFNNFIQSSHFFKEMAIDSHLNKLFKSFTLKSYKHNELIYSKDTLKMSRKIILLIEGNLIEDNSKNILASRGEIYGEELILKEKSLENDIKAYTETIVLESPWETIVQNLDIESEKPLNIFKRLSKLKKISIFKSMSEPKLISIAKMMKKQKFLEGEVILQENTLGDKFYLITKGRVKITKSNKLIRELEDGNCFGEIAVINNENRTASVTAISDVICYEISQEDFEKILDNDNIKEYLLKKISLQDMSIDLGDLYQLKFLGKGKFGFVNLVHNTRNIYAIKGVPRRGIEKMKILSKYFLSERRIMLMLDHPFIIKMVKTLKTEDFCFFLMEYVNGKNLDEYLNERKLIKNLYETQFYTASLLIMIDYLNKKNISHRDIKPSNIMIDQNGYLKLIDFGTAKILTDFSHTIIGTPHYMAPEILQGKGYSLSCDYWSIGICMFEIFYGFYPFGQQAVEVMDVYKEILYKSGIYFN